MTRLIGQDALLVALVRRSWVRWRCSSACCAVARTSCAPVRPRSTPTFGLVTVAALAMIYALVTHDFSVAYVAQVGSRATPLFYTVISLWGALEGSILFWAWVLGALLGTGGLTRTATAPGRWCPYAGVSLLAISAVLPHPAGRSGESVPASSRRRRPTDRVRIRCCRTTS